VGVGAAREVGRGDFFGDEGHGCAEIGSHGAFPVGCDEGETSAVRHFANLEARGIAAELGKAVAVEAAIRTVASLA
jgi:hypothetical protein